MTALEEKQSYQEIYFYLVFLLLFTAVVFCSDYKFGSMVERVRIALMGMKYSLYGGFNVVFCANYVANKKQLQR